MENEEIRKRRALVDGESVEVKTIAGWVRRDLKRALVAGELGKDLPEDLSFSVRTRNYRLIDVAIRGVPAEWLWEWSHSQLYRVECWQHTHAAQDLLKAVDIVRNRYNKTYDHAAANVDYARSRYYGNTEYDWRIREPELAR